MPPTPPLLAAAALLLTAGAAAAPPLLYDALGAVRFLNSGAHRAADAASLVWLDVRQEDTDPRT